jgi:hypothetical protein
MRISIARKFGRLFSQPRLGFQALVCMHSTMRASCFCLAPILGVASVGERLQGFRLRLLWQRARRAFSHGSVFSFLVGRRRCVNITSSPLGIVLRTPACIPGPDCIIVDQTWARCLHRLHPRCDRDARCKLHGFVFLRGRLKGQPSRFCVDCVV